MPFSTLIVGFGYAAKTFHFPFLQALEDFKLTGVVSSSAEKVHAEVPDVTVYESLEEALTHAQFDLVIITTPNHLHAKQAQQSLKAGCHVLVEKPFTLSADAGHRLVDLAAAQERKLCVFHNRRFDGDFLTLKQLLKNYAVGEVKRLESRFDRFRPEPRKRWRENAGLGSGIFWDLGPHLIDQALQLFGLPEKLSATIEITRKGGESDDAFELTLYYSQCKVVLGSSPFEAGPTLRFSLQGSAGSYRKFHLDPQENQLKAGLPFDSKGWAVTPENENGTLYREAEQTIVPTQKGDYLGFYTQLAKALTPGSEADLPADATSVVDVIALIELAREAARTGTIVPVSIGATDCS